MDTETNEMHTSLGNVDLERPLKRKRQYGISLLHRHAQDNMSLQAHVQNSIALFYDTHQAIAGVWHFERGRLSLPSMRHLSPQHDRVTESCHRDDWPT
jgi:hypothetical protein